MDDRVLTTLFTFPNSVLLKIVAEIVFKHCCIFIAASRHGHHAKCVDYSYLLNGDIHAMECIFFAGFY